MSWRPVKKTMSSIYGPRSLRLLCLVSLAACAAPVARGEEEEVTRPASSALIGGTVDNDDPSVVALVEKGKPVCTGTVVAPLAVLTAAHCVTDVSPDQVLLRVAGLPDFVLPVTNAVVDPDYDPLRRTADLAFVQLGTVAPTPPVPVIATQLASPVGRRVRLVGFGVDASFSPSSMKRRQGAAEIVGATNDSLQLDAAETRTCFGDSGGPALAMVDGAEEVVGVASHGNVRCDGVSVETRLDTHLADFVEPYLLSHAGDKATSGDGCVDDQLCQGGLCLSSAGPQSVRYCSDACDPRGACPSGMRCERGACRYPGPAPGTLGTACTVPSDCRSFLCVAADDPATRACSRPCDPTEPGSCPRAFDCVAVEGATVPFACMAGPDPTTEPVSGNCDLAPTGPPRSLSAQGTRMALVLAMTAMCFLRRRETRAPPDRGCGATARVPGSAPRRAWQ